MKKTLAIVLAVLMAVAALSSFAFVIGSNEKKADFELLRIFAADIDLTKSGLTQYMEIAPSTDYWTPGKSLCIAVEFRVWNRTLDGHAGAPAGKAYTIAVSSTTADMSFVEYAVAKVASYVEINGQKNLSYVAAFPNNTMAYDAVSKAALFNVVVVPQTATNVLNKSIIGLVTAKGYVPQPSVAAGLYTGNIEVPVLTYAVDPQYVDYTVFLSAKHVAPNAEGVGDLAACFALSAADGWVYLYKADGTLAATAGASVASIKAATGIDLVAKDAIFALDSLQKFYRDPAATLTKVPAYTAYLDLTEVGYYVLRADTELTKADATTVNVVRYDVFKYTPALLKSDITYIGSYVTEDLLKVPNAKAIHYEYNGSIVTFDMHGSYLISFASAAGTITNQPVKTSVVNAWLGLAGWLAGGTTGVALNIAVPAEAAEIVALNKMHADFGTGIGQAEGYPILDSQFLNAAAAAKFSTPVTNTYLAGTTVAVEAPITDEGTGSDEEVPEIGDEPELPQAGDATIAFVCAAAAILACAALAFVMKKAR